MDLSNHSTFDWLQFPEGRARFSGGVRGIMDEQRHETFAAEVNDEEYFGEIERKFLPNDNDYDVEVISFGYGRDGDIGMPTSGACCTFTATEARTIRTLIARLVAACILYPHRPSVLNEYPDAHFMGHVLFKDGWIITRQ